MSVCTRLHVRTMRKKGIRVDMYYEYGITDSQPVLRDQEMLTVE